MNETVIATPARYRAGLPERPKRMAGLPLNDKGYPVPWFVEWIDGKPEFRVMDHRKWVAAVRSRLCWLCGEPLGGYLTFVAGPMCGINRTSAEPPNHHDCASYAARACPFLTLPKAIRREAGLAELGVTEDNIVGGIQLSRNPGATMLWTTRSYKVRKVDNGYVLTMGEPTTVEWFANGRAATREEVEESIRTGLPTLQKMADQEGPSAQRELLKLVANFHKHIPSTIEKGADA